MWKDHFLIGIGPNQFGDLYLSQYWNPLEVQCLTNAHSNILQIGAESGVIGVIGFLIWIIGSLIFAIKQFISKGKEPFDFAIMCILIGFLVLFGLFEVTYFINAWMTLYWVLLALLVGLKQCNHSYME